MIVGMLALFTTGCASNNTFAGGQTERVINSNWKASCNSKYSYSNGTYTFKVKQGKVGGCPYDRISKVPASGSSLSVLKSKVKNLDMVSMNGAQQLLLNVIASLHIEAQ